jgi:hypothetical protein
MKNITATLRENLRAPGFAVLKHDRTNILGTPIDSLPNMSFDGSEIDQLGNKIPGSSVALYFAEPHFISGFLVDSGGWFFIEPVRPLLSPLVGPGTPNPRITQTDIDNCFPVSDSYHITYSQQDTIDWFIKLDPTASTPGSQVAGPTAKQATVKVTMVVDQEFHASNMANGKNDQQEAENVLNGANGVIGVISLYASQFSSFSLQEQGVDIWTSDGPGSQLSYVNPYNLLCDFAQGFAYPVKSGGSEPTGGWPHIEVAPERIVYLLSGYQLGPIIPIPTGISDNGDTICSNCGSNGTDIVGLAEGIGGFRQLEPSYLSRSCVQANGATAQFSPADHHAISQQVATKSPTGSTMNYQATLLQRVLLMAHEFGHLLGADHDDPTSPSCTPKSIFIMCPTLTSDTTYNFSSDTVNQINNCVAENVPPAPKTCKP